MNRVLALSLLSAGAATGAPTGLAAGIANDAGPASARYEISTLQLERQPTLVKRATIKPKTVPGLGSALAIALPRVHAFAVAHNAPLAGPPFTRFLEERPDSIDIEAGLPMAAEVAGEGDVVASFLPGGLTATTVHIGPYEKLDQAFAAVEAWISRSGHERNGPAWEQFISDPTTTPADKLETRVYFPIR